MRNVPAATVVNVRVGRHVGFDRLVVDLRGRPSGYRVGYVRQLAGPSGKPVSLRGRADLSVALMPAQAHTSSGRSTLSRQRRVLTLPSLKEYRLVEDFEGVVVIGVGVAHKRAFRVFTLRNPSRIVVDVRH